MMSKSKQHYFAAIAAGLVLALCACSRPPSSAELGQDEDSTLETATANAAPRLYDPMSKTADAITGALEFTDEPRVGPNETPKMKIIAGLGHIWEITFVQTVTASDKIGPEQWIAFMPVAAAAQVNVYSIDNETIDAAAINGGPCGSAGTGFMAFSEAPTESGDTQMTMAAFKDKTWPPANGAAPQLCGTFTYTLNKADAASGTP